MVFVKMRRAVQQQIQIERARRIAKTALAAVALFDVQQCGKQRARRERSFHLRHCIDEVGLIDVADRRGGIQ